MATPFVVLESFIHFGTVNSSIDDDFAFNTSPRWAGLYETDRDKLRIGEYNSSRN